MIAVALGLISLVVMVATGVVASSGADDHLAFLGVGVQTTTAQVFVTGAIFGWLFLVAIWLLRIGIHRSSERCAELAARRGRRPGEWLGFSAPEAVEAGEAADSLDFSDSPGAAGDESEDARGWGLWEQWAAATERPGVRTKSGLHDGGVTSPGGVVGGTGPAGHGGVAPWRPDGRPHHADRTVAGTAEQPGPLRRDRAPGPVTGRRPGVGMNRRAEGGQIGGGPGPMPREDRRAEGQHRGGDGGQESG